MRSKDLVRRMLNSDFVVKAGGRKFSLTPKTSRAESWCESNLVGVFSSGQTFFFENSAEFADTVNEIIRAGMFVEEMPTTF